MAVIVTLGDTTDFDTSTFTDTFKQLVDDDFVITSSSSSRIVGHIGNVDFLLKGSDLSVHNNSITGGTFTAVQGSIDGDNLFQAKGINVTFQQIVSVLSTSTTSDDLALLKSQLSGHDRLHGSNLGDQFWGYDGDDYVEGRGGKDVIFGGKGADRLYGDSGNDTISGDSGADTLFGGTGKDTLSGGSGDDRVVGGSGDDKLYGGAGVDALRGGTGQDTFIFNSVLESTLKSHDTIKDFSHSEHDVISLTAIDANLHLDGNQKFKFIDDAHFHGKAGELRAFSSSVNTYVQGDVDGDGKADFALALDGVIHLKAGDFAL